MPGVASLWLCGTTITKCNLYTSDLSIIFVGEMSFTAIRHNHALVIRWNLIFVKSTASVYHVAFVLLPLGFKMPAFSQAQACK